MKFKKNVFSLTNLYQSDAAGAGQSAQWCACKVCEHFEQT